MFAGLRPSGAGRAGQHGCGFIRKLPACSGICENSLVRAAGFLPPKGSPTGHGDQTRGGEVCAPALVLGLLLLQPKETVPDNWLVD